MTNRLTRRMDPPAANGHSTSEHSLEEFWEYQPLEPDRLQERARFYAHKAGASANITGQALPPLMVHRGYTAQSDMYCLLQDYACDAASCLSYPHLLLHIPRPACVCSELQAALKSTKSFLLPSLTCYLLSALPDRHNVVRRCPGCHARQ